MFIEYKKQLLGPAQSEYWDETPLMIHKTNRRRIQYDTLNMSFISWKITYSLSSSTHLPPLDTTLSMVLVKRCTFKKKFGR